MSLIKNYQLADWTIFHYDCVGSTNDIALQLDTPDFKQQHIIIADMQTAGRGRRGRNWISPLGNLYMTQLFAWPRPITELVYIISLSIAQAILAHNKQLNIQIKWPNDILLNNNKIAGILIEKTPHNHIVAGIGINLVSSPAPDEIIYPATSLAQHNCQLSVQQFLEKYLPAFSHNCQLDFALIRQHWLELAYKLSQSVTLKISPQNNISGIFKGIDEQGNLVLQQNQNLTTISTGEIIFKDNL